VAFRWQSAIALLHPENFPAKPAMSVKSSTNAPAANTMTPALWAILVLLSAIWGGSFLFGRIAVQEVPPLVVVWLRVMLAAIAIWLFVLLSRRKLTFSRWLIVNAAAMSILNNVIPFSLILYGQKEIGSGLASIVNAMTPIWTVLIANWLTSDEKLSRRKMAGILFGFFGVALLMGSDAARGLSASAIAQASVLAATISYGFAGVFGKRFKGHDPLVIAACQLSASTLFMAVIVFISGSAHNLTLPSPGAIGSVIGLAIPCTAIAYVMFFHILSRAGATNTSLVTFLVPVSAILLGIIFLGEALTLWHLGGMALIATGLVILDGRLIGRKPA
jgi:drug/metabolite transporter (DMT)-like permease